MGLRSALAFLKDAVGFNIDWVESALHQEVPKDLERIGKRGVSLVDCASFVVMRRRGLKKILPFDTDFLEQGFTIY